jgi:hypothetical protein
VKETTTSAEAAETRAAAATVDARTVFMILSENKRGDTGQGAVSRKQPNDRSKDAELSPRAMDLAHR